MRSFSPALLLSLSLATPVLAQSVALPTGTSQFTILQDNKPVGTTESTISASPAGYIVESHGQIQIGNFSYSFTNQNQLDSSLNLVRDHLTGTVNGAQATVDIASSPDGKELQIHSQAQAKNDNTSVDRHRNLVLLPDLDAAAYLEMTHLAQTHPQTSWVLIPKETGILVPTDYAPQVDLRGTLNGTPVLVHHTSVAISMQNSISIELYYSQSGKLLEADLPEQNFYVVRSGFNLINRPKPTPPHVSNGAPEQPGAQQQYPANQGSPQAPPQ